MMKLYGAPPTRALRVIWLLNEPGLEYAMLPVDALRGETQGQELRTLNPAAKVPVLVDGSVVLTESSAIQLYLAELKSMYARPTAPPTTGEALAALKS